MMSLFKRICIPVMGIVLCLVGCGTVGETDNQQPEKSANTTIKQKNVPLFTGDGGKGIVIVVPAPTMPQNTQTDSWMPQLFQDIITGDLARYSAMTVLDRSNEQLALAEQNLSASGNYSDDDYIKMGNLTNARYIVAGNILNVAGRYTVAFRINNTETNEIQASFTKQYTTSDIETGRAAKEVVKELLTGMGVALTEAGESALMTIPELEVKATANLAKGMAAEKQDNLVEALSFYTEAVGIVPTMKEASLRIQNFGGTIQTGNVRERAEQAQREKAKWQKIFADLETYVKNNLVIAVYDFSTVKDTIKTKAVDFQISPGIQLVPNRTVLSVWKTVLDRFQEEVRSVDKSWLPRGIGGPGDYGHISLTYGIEIYLYDDYGDRLKRGGLSNGGFQLSFNYYDKNFQVTAQHKYFDPKKYQYVSFYDISIDSLTDNVTPKVEKVYIHYSGNDRNDYVNVPIMTVSEWDTWVKDQQGK